MDMISFQFSPVSTQNMVMRASVVVLNTYLVSSPSSLYMMPQKNCLPISEYTKRNRKERMARFEIDDIDSMIVFRRCCSVVHDFTSLKILRRRKERRTVIPLEGLSPLSDV